VADFGVLNRVAAPSKNWMEMVRLGAAPDESGRRTIDGLSRTDAEELLDWLDNQSISDKELSFDPAAGFTVRWRDKSQ
jgi:hypothetical protein